jgi:transcriptional regulator with XRE-family HTH domain
MLRFIRSREKEREFKEQIHKFQDDGKYNVDRLLLDVSEQILRLMHKKNITKVMLAEQLGVSRANITQLLRGNTNLRIGTLLKIVDVLDLKLDIKLREKHHKAISDGDFESSQMSKYQINNQVITIKQTKLIEEYETENLPK